MDLVLRMVRVYRPTGRVSIRRIGSFVNDVFLVRVDNEKLVAKRYTSWVSLKWVTLSLFGLGSVHFSISGKRRMEAEYAFNDLLSRRGIPVPAIVGADKKSRTILFTFVSGDQLSSLIPRTTQSTQIGQREREAALQVGRLLAGAHQLEAALGDTKPENFLVERNGNVTFVDLEQARYRGDYAWDVAEFLFYSGHYWLSFNKSLEGYVDSFIKGYKEQGSPSVVKAAASPKYVRVFSVWTPPNILHNIRKKLTQN
jgi:tRNA A-37 threonylcarbamoyl transferase component Bud32